MTRSAQPTRVLLTVAHAAGFNASMYRPILRHLDEYLAARKNLSLTIVAPSFYGHGVNQSASIRPEDARDWPHLCRRDILLAWQGLRQSSEPVALSEQVQSWQHEAGNSQIDRSFIHAVDPDQLLMACRATREQLQHDYDVMLGFGHSMGGAVLLGLEADLPSTFDQLTLVEPVLFDTNPLTAWFASSSFNPLHRKSKRRRRYFASKQAAMKFFSQRGFRSFHSACLEGFLEEGLIAVEDGVQLACDPSFESNLYRGERNLWPLMSRIQSDVTMVVSTNPMPQVILGSTRQHFQRAVNRIGTARLEELEGSHFVCMEQPKTMAQLIMNSLDRALTN
eukprot:TRINITY_DN8999_c0_g1_i1.p1 TRINITY_DN8999_c0_g1~~TRINITY_DN8999_c0_g1_i1.p1  ORF type:complete len:336 (+),score=15.48 TRINITY_DN8999_c0_g1_i1:44-1051(+)